MVDRLGSSNCLVIAPIRAELSNIYHNGEMGYLIVTKTANALREEQILLLESLSNALSPLVKQFNEIDKMKNTYKIDYRNMFLEDLRKHIDDKISYSTNSKVFYKKMEHKLFSDPNFEDYEGIKTYYFDNYLFAISYDSLSNKQFENSIEVQSEGEFFDWIDQI